MAYYVHQKIPVAASRAERGLFLFLRHSSFFHETLCSMRSLSATIAMNSLFVGFDFAILIV